MIAMEALNGNILEIQLPTLGHQQVIAQYTDDTSLTLLEEEYSVRALIYTLETFCMASRLVLNW